MIGDRPKTGWCFAAALRGGNWDNTTNAGVFALNLNNAPSNSNTNIGFRCCSSDASEFIQKRREFYTLKVWESAIRTTVYHLSCIRLDEIGVGRIKNPVAS